jgi:hypothetical protein
VSEDWIFLAVVVCVWGTSCLSTGFPEDRPLTWREHWIISRRPDNANATDEEWLAWHEKYKDKIDTKSLMPHRFDKP